MHEISIAAEKLWSLFGFLPVTNTLLTCWVVMALVILWAVLSSRKIKSIPSGLQNFNEMVVEGLLGVYESVVGSAKQAKEFFAIVTTIFLFVLFSNWFGLLPGVGSVGFFGEKTETQVEETAATTHATTTEADAAIDSGEAKETSEAEEVAGAHNEKFTPLFRASSSDLSFTLAIAICAMFYVQYKGFKHLKLGYLKKFFNFSNPIMFFVGILELISEFAKMISFSFRLFGNVFAGEVLLVVMTFLIPYIIPVPFYGLEVFVGMVQAGVFAALTLVFLKGATAHH